MRFTYGLAWRRIQGVAVRLDKEEVQLHSWMDNTESGDIEFYNRETKSFKPLLDFPKVD